MLVIKCSAASPILKHCAKDGRRIMSIVAGFEGYPQPGGGTHPPNPRGKVLGKVLSD